MLVVTSDEIVEPILVEVVPATLEDAVVVDDDDDVTGPALLVVL